MKKEIWKDIKNYKGYYQVSNFGNIRSVRRTIKHPWNKFRIRNGKVLKPSINYDGYKHVVLSKDSIRKSFDVHRLVAETFIDKTDVIVNHKDGNKLNNNVENLEWMSHQSNMTHAKENGLLSLGEKNGRSKLKEKDVISIREKYSDGKTITSLAKDFNISKTTIHDLIVYRTWKYL